MAATGFWVSTNYQQRPQTATAGVAASLIGQPVPGFRLSSIDGAIVSPENFSGQVVLYNFWATWCAPCRKEMPLLEDFHQQYKTQGFSVVGVAIDDIQAVKQFSDKFGITYPLLVGADDVMQVNRQFGNISGGLPYSVLVDRHGIVNWSGWGMVTETRLKKQLEQLL